MKGLTVILLLAIAFTACKKDSNEPVPAVKSIVGKWRLDAYERTINGLKVWEKITDNEPSYLSFRYDGVILGTNDLPVCCGPGSYKLNGNLFKIEPKGKLPENPQCTLVDCVGCPTWDMEQNGNELIISSCRQFIRARYIRE